MTLIKTSFLSSIAVIIKILTLLGINKILAIYVGPAGYAAIGQFQNAVQMITTFASGAINGGVVKYTAEYQEDKKKQHIIWRTAGTISLLSSLVTATLVIMFNRYLGLWFLKNEALGSVFIWFAATLSLFVFNTLLLAILNGKREIKRYVLANITGSIFSFSATTIMAIKLGLYGALVALAIYQSISFFATLFLAHKTSWFRIKYLFGRIDKEAAKKLSKFTAMALIAAICAPTTHILIREYLGETLSWESAGYWEAMWRLSSAYLMLVTSTLSVYYLPKLAQLEEVEDIKKEIVQGYKIILPTTAACGLTIFLLRNFITNILFSSDFSPMEELFAWQMVGDTLKIGSWLLAYIMLAKAMTKIFIISEISFSISFYVLTIIFTQYTGLKAVTIAYAINYFFYWIMMAIIIFNSLQKNYKAANPYNTFS